MTDPETARPPWPVRVRPLIHRPYEQALTAMRRFTAARTPDTIDEIWLLEHPPVFTQGLAGKAEHVLSPGPIPVIATERGGQVTYHGPGQLVAYILLDLARRGLPVRDLVCRLEQGLINCLASVNIGAIRRAGAPGVYVEGDGLLAGSKIAALGLKISRGRSFHGVALNVAMDLEPFSRINPCGYADLAVTDIRSVLARRASIAPVDAPDGQTPRPACARAPACENDGLPLPPTPADLAPRLAACLAQALDSPVMAATDPNPELP